MHEPIVKWVGGKRKLLPQLAPLLPRPLDIHYYAEPFVGGAAMLFHIAAQWPAERRKLLRWNINDINADLISFYSAVANYPNSVADVACRFASQHNAPSYKKARATFNTIRQYVGNSRLWNAELSAVHAGLFLYLNKCGFNGLYRTNKLGELNTSPNADAKWRPKLDELGGELRAAGVVLGQCMRTSFTDDVFIDEQIKYSILSIEPEHVFFFVDPPYLNDEQDGFTGYSSARWTTTDLMTLALSMQQVHEAGARFMLTHVDTELVRDLFDHQDYNLTPITARQTISQTTDGRGERAELVIRNYR